MRHFNLITNILVFSTLSCFGMSNQAKQTFKQLTTKESTLNWMELKKEKTKNVFLSEVKTIFDLNDFSEFKVLKSEKDELGWMHHNIQQFYNGIPIEGAKYILHEKDGYIIKANGKLIPSFTNTQTKPSISKEAGIKGLLNQINAKTYIWQDEHYENSLKARKQDNKTSYFPEAELVYMSRDFDDNFENYRLAYKMEVISIEPFEGYTYYVDAHTGELIYKISTMHSCTAGTGQTNYSGTVDITTDYHQKVGEYRLHNDCLEGDGYGIITQRLDNSAEFCCSADVYSQSNNWTSDKNAVEVFWATEKFYEYFLEYHQRSSTDGSGELLEANVGLKFPTNCIGNDCWSAYYVANQAWFSDGTPSYGAPVSIDIVAHEFTHGLINNSANLLYHNESGALNESFADIFGVAVERLKGRNLNGLDWLIGEDAKIQRNMSNPNDMDLPDTYKGNFWWRYSSDNGGVHTNSSVQNYWFYLLSEGGSGTNDHGNNYNVNGIGIVDAAKIAYRNLTVYLYDNADYKDAENGSIQAAIDWYGVNSNEVQQVRNAWCAVGGSCSNKNVTLTSPNGNEFLFGNAVKQITWTNVNVQSFENIVIELSLDDRGTWKVIDTVQNTGSYNWKVPSLLTALGKIRITLLDDFSVRDVSIGRITIISCTLNSDFDITTTEPYRCVNNLISFVNRTNNINNPLLNGVNYSWLVDGVEQSNNTEFQYVFTSSDTYDITLNVSDADGCSNSVTRSIFIHPASDADFIWDQQTASNFVDFVANQPDATNYNWTVNNATISTAKTFTFDFGSFGNYQVCLTTNGTCGSSNICKTIQVTGCSGNINANFNINNSEICTNELTSFSSNSAGANSYEWYVNGIYLNSTSTFFYQFPASGKYTVLLKAKNTNGTCEDITSQAVTVHPNANELGELSNYMDCTFASTTLDAKIDSMQTYEWKLITLNDGLEEGITVVGYDKTIVVNQSGVYILTATDRCGNRSSRRVFVALNDQDCIRPGDLNFDGEVNMDDIIYFGLHYGDCGYARDDQGIDWRNYSGVDWGSTLFNDTLLDLKHIDANGNGCVDLADWDALRFNWLEDHQSSNNSAIEPIKAIDGFNLHLVKDDAASAIGPTGGTGLLVHNLNVETDQDFDVQLYAGYAIYNLGDIESNVGQISGQPIFSIDNNLSWLTDGIIDNVNHQYYDPVSKEYRIAFSRLDKKNRLGSGRIGQIGIPVGNVIPPVEGSYDYVIEPVEVAFFNSVGEILPLDQTGSGYSIGKPCRNNNILVNNNGNTIDYRSYYTTGTITTNEEVDIVNLSDITYSANRVRLNSGFTARANSNFKVRYGCNPLVAKEKEEGVEKTQQEFKDNELPKIEHPIFKNFLPQKD